MKRVVSMLGGILFFFFMQGQTISLSTDKTTSLVFPFAVLHADRGSRDIIVQQIPEARNVLLVKAVAKDFHSTNLTVATSDGSIYSLNAAYDASPAQLVYEITAQLHESVETYARSVITNSKFLHGIGDRNWGIVSRITGLYSKDEVLYCQVHLENRSAIDYGVDFLRCYIGDKKKGGRTATQETEWEPLFIAGNKTMVKAHSRSVLVLALPKFTIPDAKYFAVEINERNGGRHLSMKLNNRKLIKAIALPDLQ